MFDTKIQHHIAAITVVLELEVASHYPVVYLYKFMCLKGEIKWKMKLLLFNLE